MTVKWNASQQPLIVGVAGGGEQTLVSPGFMAALTAAL